MKQIVEVEIIHQGLFRDGIDAFDRCIQDTENVLGAGVCAARYLVDNSSLVCIVPLTVM
jgi:hypothetical protein